MKVERRLTAPSLERKNTSKQRLAAHPASRQSSSELRQRCWLDPPPPRQKAVTGSPHREVLFDEYSPLCGDVVLDSHTIVQALLAAALTTAAKAADINLKAAGITAGATADTLSLRAAGLKHGAPDQATFKKRIKRFTKVFIAGLKESSRASAGTN